MFNVHLYDVFGAVVGDLVGVDEKLRERWLSVQCCCWLCG